MSEDLRSKLVLAACVSPTASSRVCADGSDHEETTSCEPVEFLQTLSELSSRFSSQPSSQIDSEVKQALPQIARYARADRSVIWRFEENGCGLVQTYEWFHSGFSPYSNEMLIEGFRWGREQLKLGHTLAFQNITLLPPEANGDRRVFEETHHSAVTGVPLSVDGKVVGALCVYGQDPAVYFRLSRWRVFGDVIANGIMRRNQESAMQSLIAEFAAFREKVEAESVCFQVQPAERSLGTLIGQSEAFRKVLRITERVSHADTTVLITGETGTGKELIARGIHDFSSRRRGPMIKVNCAALPADLIESELFGHESGAFTGAGNTRLGRFEAADGGTIFLDEVGELPLALQAKLLRVLQEGELERLGSVVTRRVDVRVVAATNADLSRAVEEGRFRRDLYYRLNVVPIHCPPLRDRADDIPLLVEHFVNMFSRKTEKTISAISRRALSALQSYSWPGNVRELKNAVERAVLFATKQRLTLQDVFPERVEEVRPPGILTLHEEEREHILKVLKLVNWRVSGPRGAAMLLGMNPKTLESRMKKLGILRPVYLQP